MNSRWPRSGADRVFTGEGGKEVVQAAVGLQRETGAAELQLVHVYVDRASVGFR